MRLMYRKYHIVLIPELKTCKLLHPFQNLAYTGRHPSPLLLSHGCHVEFVELEIHVAATCETFILFLRNVRPWSFLPSLHIRGSVRRYCCLPLNNTCLEGNKLPLEQRLGGPLIIMYAELALHIRLDQPRMMGWMFPLAEIHPHDLYMYNHRMCIHQENRMCIHQENRMCIHQENVKFIGLISLDKTNQQRSCIDFVTHQGCQSSVCRQECWQPDVLMLTSESRNPFTVEISTLSFIFSPLKPDVCYFHPLVSVNCFLLFDFSQLIKKNSYFSFLSSLSALNSNSSLSCFYSKSFFIQLLFNHILTCLYKDYLVRLMPTFLQMLHCHPGEIGGCIIWGGVSGNCIILLSLPNTQKLKLQKCVILCVGFTRKLRNIVFTYIQRCFVYEIKAEKMFSLSWVVLFCTANPKKLADWDGPFFCATHFMRPVGSYRPSLTQAPPKDLIWTGSQSITPEPQEALFHGELGMLGGNLGYQLIHSASPNCRHTYKIIRISVWQHKKYPTFEYPHLTCEKVKSRPIKWCKEALKKLNIRHSPSEARFAAHHVSGPLKNGGACKLAYKPRQCSPPSPVISLIGLQISFFEPTSRAVQAVRRAVLWCRVENLAKMAMPDPQGFVFLQQAFSLGVTNTSHFYSGPSPTTTT
ncbi:hypothetical protein VP01_385g1 [Puccinia sorghi]|uniref:Uncharacterized protein n=1 Tax=Puccinia sorghi TaxID=27349 RepID=A0A0L6UTW0_9BASI|nr:hypothetical protein VP01_385g1 [Puccinia sorghi]